MSNNRFLVLKKWTKMLSGNSVFHLNQKVGKYYSKDELEGYYSDLRHKVSSSTLIDDAGIPFNVTSNNKRIYFAITIFQYGLGAYDLFLETNDASHQNKLFIVANWALKHQEVNGAWDTFSFKSNTNKESYSSMAQGEGVSVLLRAFKESGEKKYLDGAKAGVEFMLLSTKEGGTTSYVSPKEFTFEEGEHYKTILNGAIFSLWGLYDYCLVTKESYYIEMLNNAANHLSNILDLFDCGYWSNYDLEDHITSPFYHNLHINQLIVLYDLFSIDNFRVYYEKWTKYEKSFVKSKFAFCKKVFQKLVSINTDITLVK